MIRRRPFAGIGAILAVAGGTHAMAAGTVGDFGQNLDRTTSLHHFQVDKEPFIGQRFDFSCPAVTVRDKNPPLVGTDVYPANSPICVAAQHAGVVGTEGGMITLQLNPGAGKYQGSRRHGVESTDLPGTQLSIMFLSSSTRAKLDAIQDQWKPRLKWEDKFSQTGLANIRLTGQRFAFECPAAPANLAGRVVYGTDVYPLSSLVCLSAVHAGQISKSGGAVLVEMEPAIADSFVGSIRHGIESKNGPKTARSITFPGGKVETSAAKAERPEMTEEKPEDLFKKAAGKLLR